MRRRHRVALVGAGLFGLVAAGYDASAQSVPLPVPAPHTRMRVPPAPAKPSKATTAAPRQVAQASGTNVAPLPPAGIPAAGVPAAGAAGVAAGVPAAKPAAAPVRSGGSATFDGPQRALIERANTYLSGLNTLVGNFVQVGPDGRRTEGRFYLLKPGRVRFEYNPPSPIELIADGSSVVIRDRKLATQDVWPLSQTPLRFLVADRIDLLKDTNVIGTSSDDTFATVVIEERQALGGTHRLMLMFGARDFQLRQWTITDPQGYDTTVALYNLDAKQKPDPGLFKIDYTRYLQ